MLVWADKMFDCFGPEDDRTRQAWPVLDEMMRYATTQAVRGKVKPGSWAEAVLDAADRDEVDRSLCPVLMIDYMGPSLDTKSSSARFQSRMQARGATRCRPLACATAMYSRKKASDPAFSIRAFQDTKSWGSSMNWAPVFPSGRRDSAPVWAGTAATTERVSR